MCSKSWDECMRYCVFELPISCSKTKQTIPKPMKTTPWFLLIFGIIAVFWWQASKNAALLLFGETTSAQVLLVTQHSGRHTTYSAFYEFTTSDKQIAHGDCPCKKNAEGKFLTIRYLKAFPSINEPANTTIRVFTMICWAIGGWLIAVFILFRKSDPTEEEPDQAPPPLPAARDTPSRLNRWFSSLVLGLTVFVVCLALLSPQTQPLWSWISNLFEDEDVPAFSMAPGEIQRGNQLGNPENGNLFAQSDGVLYFHQWKDYEPENPLPAGLYKCTTSGNSGYPTPVETKGKTSEIYKGVSFYEGWIYLQTMAGLARIRPDGSHFKKIISERVFSYCIVNGFIYFQMEYDSRRIYRSNLNGSAKKRLCLEETGVFSVAGNGWIYYTNETDHGLLYRIRENGSHREAIEGIYPSKILATPEKLWFVDKKDEKLKCMNPEIGEIQEISQRKVVAFSISGNDVIAISEDAFYRITPETGTDDRIAPTVGEYRDFSLLENRIYQRAESIGHGAIASIGFDEHQWTFLTRKP